MIYVEAPNDVRLPVNKLKIPTVFLGGGITGTFNWQEQVAKLLKDEEMVVYNPRREHFDTLRKEVMEEQIEWEFRKLWECDIITFWFCNNTLQPITLLELGARLAIWKLANTNKNLKQEILKNYKLPKVLIGIEQGYQREDDVLVQTECVIGKKPVISRTLEDLAERIKKAAKTIY